VGDHGGFEVYVRDAFFADFSDMDRDTVDDIESADVLEALSQGGELGVDAGAPPLALPQERPTSAPPCGCGALMA